MMQTLRCSIYPRFVLLILLFFILLPARLAAEKVSQTAPRGWLSSVSDARAEAAERDAFILVDLYADWCGWCKVLEREVFPSEVFQRFAADFVLLRVDVEDRGEGSEMQARYAVQSLPTTLILDADGVRVGAVPGYAPAGRFVDKLRAEIAGYERLLERFEEVRRGGGEAARWSLAETFHQRRDGRRAAALYQQLATGARRGSPGWAELQTRLADAQRLAGDFDGARRSLAGARDAAGDLGDPLLIGQLELLHAQIAREAGDCEEAERSLESFLRDHPRSPLYRQARQTLAALRRGDVACS